VEVGHGQVIASSHPEAIAFCKNLLAKKFVVSILVTVDFGWLSFFFQFRTLSCVISLATTEQMIL
jgi:hypothetical protein